MGGPCCRVSTDFGAQQLRARYATVARQMPMLPASAAESDNPFERCFLAMLTSASLKTAEVEQFFFSTCQSLHGHCSAVFGVDRRYVEREKQKAALASV